MKKQGFTLIELMVVIVIMGILAAVAVPKLFGMIAKSKASEVGPAAGTYVKLQSAYVSEKSVYGGWKLIGYIGPGTNDSEAESSSTTNFTYAGAIGGTDETNAATDNVWTAENKAKLNDCNGAVNWAIATYQVADGADSYNATTNCPELTPNFTSIGK